MFNWFKKLLGITEVNAAVEAVQPEPVKQSPKKTTKKKSSKKIDYSSMNKAELLALCKEKGLKANSGLKKAELIERLK